MRSLWGAAVLVVVVTGCGSESSAPPAAELDRRAKTVGVVRALVYVTELPGFTRAAGGMGPYGGSGFQDIYTSPSGGDVRLTVEQGSLTPERCGTLPIPAAEPAGLKVTCVKDAAGWYRFAGDRHEYALVKGALLIRVSGMLARASRVLLGSAAGDARPATAAELDEMLPDGPPAPTRPLEGDRGGGGEGEGEGEGDGEPPERGDLPDNGDGAPDNEAGPGG